MNLTPTYFNQTTPAQESMICFEETSSKLKATAAKVEWSFGSVFSGLAEWLKKLFCCASFCSQKEKWIEESSRKGPNFNLQVSSERMQSPEVASARTLTTPTEQPAILDPGPSPFQRSEQSPFPSSSPSDLQVEDLLLSEQELTPEEKELFSRKSTSAILQTSADCELNRILDSIELFPVKPQRVSLYHARLGFGDSGGSQSGPSLNDPSSEILMQYPSPHDPSNLDHSETLQNPQNLTARGIHINLEIRQLVANSTLASFLVSAMNPRKIADLQELSEAQIKEFFDEEVDSHLDDLFILFSGSEDIQREIMERYNLNSQFLVDLIFIYDQPPEAARNFIQDHSDLFSGQDLDPSHPFEALRVFSYHKSLGEMLFEKGTWLLQEIEENSEAQVLLGSDPDLAYGYLLQNPKIVARIDEALSLSYEG